MTTTKTSIQTKKDKGSDDATCYAPVKTWVQQKPTEPGAYWVKGFNVGRPARRQTEALVHVRKYRGKLVSNIHKENSDDEVEDWSLLSDTCDRFFWCGPLFPHNK